MNYKRELTPQQFNGLSWLAYYQERYINGEGMHSDVMCSANFCENVLQIPHKYVYAVTVEGNLKGLQRMNRLSGVEYYD